MGTKIYAHGTLPLYQIKKILDSKDAVLYFEENEKEPEGWNWLEQGFFHGKSTEIKDVSEAVKYIEKELNGEGSLYYELLDSYFDKVPNPYDIKESKDPFTWTFNDGKYIYKIVESTYLPGYTPEHPSLSLEMVKVGVGESAMSIGSWTRDCEEGYEFRSIGSRLFDKVPEDCVEIIWSGIKKADAYLAERFKKEC